MAREDIYKMACALSRDTSPSSKRLPKYPPPYHNFIIDLLESKTSNSVEYNSVLILIDHFIKLVYYYLVYKTINTI
jgi:hypothetical protein